jgi:hypothetical protein
VTQPQKALLNVQTNTREIVKMAEKLGGSDAAVYKHVARKAGITRSQVLE